MEYGRVAQFVAVVKAGSFTRAAAEVGLPKSSMSRSVSNLEKELGVRLLQRTTRKIALTEAGQAYYDAVRSAVTSIDEATAAVRELGAEPRGHVRVTAPMDIGAGDLALALSQFARKHPGIRVEMSFSSRIVNLLEEGFDLAIRAGKLEDSTLVVRRIGASEAAVFGSPAYLRRSGRPKSVDDLKTHEWVLYRAHGGRSVISLTGPLGEATVDVNASLVADEMSFCRAACEAGAGLALLPVHLAAEAVSTGRLEHVLAGWSLKGASINVVLPSSRYVPARVALVRDLLVEYLTNMLSESLRRCEKPRGAAKRATG